MHGLSYNLVLIAVPLLFWAAIRWRQILTWAVQSWRARRAAQAGLSPDDGLEPPATAGPQVSSPAGLSGEGPGGGSEGGPEEGAGKGADPIVETLDNGVTGAWIRVQRQGGRDA
ncbi:hypothetical protein ABT297_03935 [Dactylosporangium sp. NPDC000555]|uniref:hypothetical protein n=1 Tax=Dactylosporangium sp. NPDC000555 TaxID=3154260 RepID=UPI003332738D